jgi:hypothetical protein
MFKHAARVLGLTLCLVACSEAPATTSDDARQGPSLLERAGGGLASRSEIKLQFPTGRLHAYTKSGEACAWTVNGTPKGTGLTLDQKLLIGTYNVRCTRADGATATQSVEIKADAISTAILAFPAENGTLVAVAVGGKCGFSVNGVDKGVRSQLELSVAPRVYAISCKPSTGAATQTKYVKITTGNTAMAMFKL